MRDRTNTPHRFGEIMVVRHGEPVQNRRVWINAEEYRKWWAGYDEAGLVPGEAPPDGLLVHARRADIIFSSSLRRAQETARLAGEGRPFTPDEVFREAPLPPPPFPSWVRMTPWAWGTVARIGWRLGYSGGAESYTMAVERAKAAADRLIEAARGGSNVMLCAHGWFNRMIRKQLRARGWDCVFDGGDYYWSYRRYHPPRHRH